MEIAIIVLLIIVIGLLIFNLIRTKPNNALSNDDLFNIKKTIAESLVRIDDKLNSQTSLIDEKNKALYEKIDIRIKSLEESINKLITLFNSTNELINVKLERINKLNAEFSTKLLEENHQTRENLQDKLSSEIKEFSKVVTETLNKLNRDVHNELKEIREDNNQKLDRINQSVNEKLEKTLEGKLRDSFNNVIEQIGGVNKAIGEIKGIASDVGSLKNVLTNVKTKGIVGEVILGNIIKEILTVNQYEENVVTKDKSNDRVEFAIKMPGENDGFIYLPIDSKLPLENYSKITEGIDQGNVDLINEGRKGLKAAIKQYAKDISQKYIDVPNTTDFAIMFLPIEGLYIEVLNMGLFEEIQREYHVNIAGPTTLTALLNALQMGFKTLTIQKKSADVFKLLGAVKTEFENFAEVLDKAQKKVNEASDQLDTLVGTRTRKIRSKLKEIEFLEGDEAKEILGIK